MTLKHLLLSLFLISFSFTSFCSHDEIRFVQQFNFENLSREEAEYLSAWLQNQAAPKAKQLHWYNKLYRKINDCVALGVKHEVPLKATKITIVAFLVWYALWFNSERGTRSDGNSYFMLEYWLRDFVGAHAHFDKWGELLSWNVGDYHFEGNPIGTLGRLQVKMNDYNRGMGFMQLILLASMIYFYRHEIQASSHWTMATVKWSSEKLDELHRFMLGDNECNAKMLPS